MAEKILTCSGGQAKVIVKNETEHLQKHWAMGKFYEQNMLEYIRKHYRRGGTFLDIGACIGNHTLFFAKFCGAKRVLSVEPVESSFKHLTKNVHLNELDERVTAINAAVSDWPRYMAMESFAPDGHNNVGMHKLASGSGTNVTTVDRLVESLKLRNITLVKIDVEYHELAVLRGMANLLKTQRPALFVEITDEQYKRVSAFLEQFGYRVKSQHNASPTYEFIPARKSEGLHILSVSDYDFAGCGYFLSEAINSHTPHTSRAVRENKMALEFPYDLQSPSNKRLKRLGDWADIIHIHSEYKRLDLLPRKKTVITYHGKNYRNNYKKKNRRDRKRRWIQTAASIDLLRYGKLTWLPNTRPSLLHLNTERDGFIICQAPTKKGVTKGTDTVREACKLAGVEYYIIDDATWSECLERKARASVLIDQFTYGYGCNAIEAWAMGQMVISGGDNRTIGHIKRLANVLPFVRSTEDVHILVGLLEKLKEGPSLRETIRGRGQWYYERYHTMPAVAQVASGIYERAAQKQGRKSGKNYKKYDGRYTVIEYTGKNWGSEKYLPEPGVKYTFCLIPQLRRQRVLTQHVPYFMSVKDERTGKRKFRVIE